MTEKPDILITDLDGTLLQSDHKLHAANRTMLEHLGKLGITRVIATGRNLYSLKKVVDPAFPVDFVLFSSGAAVIDWSLQKLIYQRSIARDKAAAMLRFLYNNAFDFMVQAAVPDNHYFVHHKGSQTHNPDFFRRILLYERFARPWAAGMDVGPVCQFLVILPRPDRRMDFLKENSAGLQFIRTTSPLDGRSVWIELFEEGVSKGQTARWLCNYLKKDMKKALAIGNDYNDLDLLEEAGHSFVVANAPADLGRKFKKTKSNNTAGFAYAVQQVLDY